MRRAGGSSFRNATLMLVISVLTFAGGEVWQGCADEAQIKAKLEALRKAGEPTTGEELDRLYSEPPVGENAASILTNAFAKLHLERLSELSAVPIMGTARLPEPGMPLTSEMREGIQRVLASNREALQLLHEGVQRNECRYPSDFRLGLDSVKLPHLAKIKTAAELLDLEALLAADDGQTSKSAEAIADFLRLGMTLRNEPSGFSQLIRMACNHIAYTGLEWVLNRQEFTDSELHKLQEVFAKSEFPQAARLAMVAQRANLIMAYQLPRAKRDAWIEQLLFLEPDAKASQEDWPGDITICLNFFERIIDAIEHGEKTPGDLNKQLGQVKIKRHVLTKIILPAFVRIVEKNSNDMAYLRSAQVVIAVERYRRAHQNELPASLEELAPKWLEHLPLDPFGGESFQYEKQPAAGYRISSRGMNGKKPIGITVK